jgi:hypothetical protein
MKVTYDQALEGAKAHLRAMRRAYVEQYPNAQCPIVEWDNLPAKARYVFIKAFFAGVKDIGVEVDLAAPV